MKTRYSTVLIVFCLALLAAFVVYRAFGVGAKSASATVRPQVGEPRPTDSGEATREFDGRNAIPDAAGAAQEETSPDFRGYAFSILSQGGSVRPTQDAGQCVVLLADENSAVRRTIAVRDGRLRSKALWQAHPNSSIALVSSVELGGKRFVPVAGFSLRPERATGAICVARASQAAVVEAVDVATGRLLDPGSVRFVPLEDGALICIAQQSAFPGFDGTRLVSNWGYRADRALRQADKLPSYLAGSTLDLGRSVPGRTGITLGDIGGIALAMPDNPGFRTDYEFFPQLLEKGQVGVRLRAQPNTGIEVRWRTAHSEKERRYELRIYDMNISGNYLIDRVDVRPGASHAFMGLVPGKYGCELVELSREAPLWSQSVQLSAGELRVVDIDGEGLLDRPASVRITIDGNERSLLSLLSGGGRYRVCRSNTLSATNLVVHRGPVEDFALERSPDGSSQLACGSLELESGVYQLFMEQEALRWSFNVGRSNMSRISLVYPEEDDGTVMHFIGSLDGRPVTCDSVYAGLAVNGGAFSVGNDYWGGPMHRLLLSDEGTAAVYPRSSGLLHLSISAGEEGIGERFHLLDLDQESGAAVVELQVGSRVRLHWREDHWHAGDAQELLSGIRVLGSSGDRLDIFASSVAPSFARQGGQDLEVGIEVDGVGPATVFTDPLMKGPGINVELVQGGTTTVDLR